MSAFVIAEERKRDRIVFLHERFRLGRPFRDSSVTPYLDEARRWRTRRGVESALASLTEGEWYVVEVRR